MPKHAPTSREEAWLPPGGRCFAQAGDAQGRHGGSDPAGKHLAVISAEVLHAGSGRVAKGLLRVWVLEAETGDTFHPWSALGGCQESLCSSKELCKSHFPDASGIILGVFVGT